MLLHKSKVLPDFEAPLEYIHRRTPGSDIYFVANPDRKAINCRVLFRVNKHRAELWYPDTGVIEKFIVAKKQDDGRTSIPLHLDPAGSVFVVFREGINSSQIVDIKENGRSIIPTDTISSTLVSLTLSENGSNQPEARVRTAGGLRSKNGRNGLWKANPVPHQGA
jgi:hypothetical protein